MIAKSPWHYRWQTANLGVYREASVPTAWPPEVRELPRPQFFWETHGLRPPLGTGSPPRSPPPEKNLFFRIASALKSSLAKEFVNSQNTVRLGVVLFCEKFQNWLGSRRPPGQFWNFSHPAYRNANCESETIFTVVVKLMKLQRRSFTVDTYSRTKKNKKRCTRPPPKMMYTITQKSIRPARK